MAGFPISSGGTANVGTSSIDLFFDNYDARFFGELGLPDLQGWTIDNDVSLFDDTVFDVDKKCIRFLNEGNAQQALTDEDWVNVLTYGASWSGTVRFESRTSANSVLAGLGFSAANDPRPTSIRARGLFRVNLDAVYTTVEIFGQGAVLLDGTNDKPLVLINEYFKFEVVLNPTPDSGANFGGLDLYINETFIHTGAIIATGNDAVTNVVKISRWGGSGDILLYVENFGITIYRELSTKLLTAQEMENDSILVVLPPGKRDYTIILPDDSPRGIGNIFKMVASNSTGNITLRTQDLNNPQVLFNGENEYLIYIESEKTITFTNKVVNGNTYQGTIPHEYVMPHEHIGLNDLEVFTINDLENAFGLGGTYNIVSDVSITFMNDIVIDSVFNIESGANFIMQASNHAVSVEFTNTGTIFTHAGSGQLRIKHGKFAFSGINATLFNANVSNYIIDWVTFSCTGTGITLGTITAAGIFKITNSTITGFADGYTIDTNLFTMFSNVFQTTLATSNTVMTFVAVGLAASMNDTAVIMGISENLFDINSAITTQFQIEGVASQLNLGNYFKSGSLDETSKYITVEKAGKQINSNIGTAMSVKNNAVETPTTPTAGAWYPLNLNTATLGDLNSRFSLTNAQTGERSYDGLFPIRVAGFVSLSVLKASANNLVYSFRMIKTSGSDPFDAVEMKRDLSSIEDTLSFAFSGLLNPGDTFRPEIMASSGTDSITITSYSDAIK